MKKTIKNCNYLITILLLLLIYSCSNSGVKRTTIRGNFADAAGVKLILEEMDTHDILSVDSVTPGDAGTFSFSPVVREAGFWLIRAPSGKVLVMLLNPGDEIVLSGSMKDFPADIRIQGSPEALALNEFYLQTGKNEQLVDSLEILIADRQDSADFYQFTRSLDTVFRQIWENQRNLEITFIGKHAGSLSTLVVLNYAFGMSPVLDPQEDLRYYQLVDSALLAKYPENKHVKFHHGRLQKANGNP